MSENGARRGQRQGRRGGRPRKAFPPAQALAAAQEHLGRNNDDIIVTLAERILELRAQRKLINDQIGAVKAEAKDAGIVNHTLQGRIREMEMTPEARSEAFALEHEYRVRLELGPYIDTPLGEAAMRRAEEQY